MANVSRPCGLRPINQPFGNIRCNYYEAATGTAFYMFQPVDLDANGRVVVATASDATLILGSIVGMADDAFGPPDDAYSGYTPANPASVNSAGLVNLLIADDPDQLFLIEEETGGGSQLTATNVGNGASFTYTATTGNSMNGRSNACLDASTVATSTTQTLRLIKKLDKPDNAYGAYCKWVVKINRHRLSGMNLIAGNLI
jgi:hypothetical protein